MHMAIGNSCREDACLGRGRIMIATRPSRAPEQVPRHLIAMKQEMPTYRRNFRCLAEPAHNNAHRVLCVQFLTTPQRSKSATVSVYIPLVSQGPREELEGCLIRKQGNSTTLIPLVQYKSAHLVRRRVLGKSDIFACQCHRVTFA